MFQHTFHTTRYRPPSANRPEDDERERGGGQFRWLLLSPMVDRWWKDGAKLTDGLFSMFRERIAINRWQWWWRRQRDASNMHEQRMNVRDARLHFTEHCSCGLGKICGILTSYSMKEKPHFKWILSNRACTSFAERMRDRNICNMRMGILNFSKELKSTFISSDWGNW